MTTGRYFRTTAAVIHGCDNGHPVMNLFARFSVTGKVHLYGIVRRPFSNREIGKGNGGTLTVPFKALNVSPSKSVFPSRSESLQISKSGGCYGES